MRNIFNVIIEAIYWIGIFLSPTLLLGAVAIGIYFSNEDNLWISVILLFTGIVIGIIFAERIRRKYGCSYYMAKILSTPDIDGDTSSSEK